MFNKNIQVLLGIFAIIIGLVYISCDEDEGCPSTYDKEPICNEDTICDDDETVMSCPTDCWDINKTTTCRAAYNETRMSCVDFTVDTDATDKTPMEIYQHIHDSCIQLGRTENCQFRDEEGEISEEECIIKVSQEYSCLEMACIDVSNYHICMISPRNTDSGQIMSLDFGVTTIPVLPYDGWTQTACDQMSGLDIYSIDTVSNDIIQDDALTCDLY
jgi:hypothetical protein